MTSPPLLINSAFHMNMPVKRVP